MSSINLAVRAGKGWRRKSGRVQPAGVPLHLERSLVFFAQAPIQLPQNAANIVACPAGFKGGRFVARSSSAQAVLHDVMLKKHKLVFRVYCRGSGGWCTIDECQKGSTKNSTLGHRSLQKTAFNSKEHYSEAASSRPGFLNPRLNNNQNDLGGTHERNHRHM